MAVALEIPSSPMRNISEVIGNIGTSAKELLTRFAGRFTDSLIGTSIYAERSDLEKYIFTTEQKLGVFQELGLIQPDESNASGFSLIPTIEIPDTQGLRRTNTNNMLSFDETKGVLTISTPDFHYTFNAARKELQQEATELLQQIFHGTEISQYRPVEAIRYNIITGMVESTMQQCNYSDPNAQC